jgi:hypothetical protein
MQEEETNDYHLAGCSIATILGQSGDRG